jgi:hypothetical protein
VGLQNKQSQILIMSHSSQGLEVIAWDQPNLSAASLHCSLPPSIVLVAQNCKDISFTKPEFFRDGSLIHIGSPG